MLDLLGAAVQVQVIADRLVHDLGELVRRQGLEQRGIRVSAFPQHDARMIPASQRLYDAIVEGRLVHPDDERLNVHVANTIARHGRRGWRVDKANRADKIDACIALCMALDRLENRPAPTRLVGWL